MSEHPLDLHRIQSWMQTVITHPGGVVEGMASSDARQQIEASPETVDAVVEPSRSLSSLERLQIYANAYYARLLECLQAEFPAFAHAVGEEAFGAFAFGYLQSYPSVSYTLGELGRHFPQYLVETSHRADSSDGRPDWTDFLIDLATLERIFSEVFDGPGTERSHVLTEGNLAKVSPEAWPELKLIPVPCLRLVELRFPVQEYASAVRKQNQARIPEPAPTWLAITRRNYIVRRLPLASDEFQLLRMLITEKPVGEAIAESAVAGGENPELFAKRLEAWFRRWAAEGFFSGVV